MQKLRILFLLLFINNILAAQELPSLSNTYYKLSIPTFYLTSGVFGEFLVLNSSYDTALKRYGNIEMTTCYFNRNLKSKRKYIYNGDIPQEVEKKIAFSVRMNNMKRWPQQMKSSIRKLNQHKSRSKSDTVCTRDHSNRIVRKDSESETQDFKFDSIGNLISYEWHFKNSLFCANTVWKWTGHYENSKLTQELLYWISGEVDTINHIWEEEKLIRTTKKGNHLCFMSCDIRYSYNDGLLNRIDYDIDSAKHTHYKTFSWQMITSLQSN